MDQKKIFSLKYREKKKENTEKNIEYVYKKII